LGVSAHLDDLESRFAFRTRLLDCFWARVPIVATAGDTIGDLVRSRGLGRAVPAGDVRAWVEALGALLDDPVAYEGAREQLAAVREDYLWPRAVEPLRRLVRESGTALPRNEARSVRGKWISVRVRHAVAARGPLGAARRVTQLAFRRGARRAVR
jgi:hypothetical protein